MVSRGEDNSKDKDRDFALGLRDLDARERNEDVGEIEQLFGTLKRTRTMKLRKRVVKIMKRKKRKKKKRKRKILGTGDGTRLDRPDDWGELDEDDKSIGGSSSGPGREGREVSLSILDGSVGFGAQILF